MENGYFGTVIDNDDPKKIGRVKVRVNGFYDNVDESIIPWAIPKNISFNRLDPPPIDSIVQIDFIEGEIMCPIWYTFNGKSANDMGIDDNEYTKSAVLLYKDLEEYESSGLVKVLFTEKDGLILQYDKDDESAIINLRKDNTLYFKNSQYDKVIHLSNESISLGSEDKSEEPATLGQTNHDALDMTNETIKAFSEIVDSFAKEASQICIKSSVLMPLFAPFLKLNTQLKSQISGKMYKSNKDFYPKTKSKIVSLD
ncbi:phage-related baseplate assembly [Tenacibaculum phage pT24]|uniref:Phage-related baseplate assembly n=1 Tax=Tenacibaculum phage pT24 TaxID=1880590 RepID=A0A1B4XWW9_9CAUD|nr:baseplate protein [Tenacibaculum phage pT24]BAV39288.1 phage-related baseplate assembly [Tenacibaculum phage pT24]